MANHALVGDMTAPATDFGECQHTERGRVRAAIGTHSVRKVDLCRLGAGGEEEDATGARGEAGHDVDVAYITGSKYQS